MQQKTQKAPTLLQLWAWLITRFVGWLVMGCFGCVVVAIVMVILHGLSALTSLQAVIQNDYQIVVATAQPHTLSLMNQVLNAIPNAINPPNYSLPMISQQYQQDLWAHLLPVASAALLASKLVIIRLYLLLRWLPLFLLLGLAGLIDGLAQRHIRRASAGRESALIYHNAKPLVMLSLLLGIFIDLVLPISISRTEEILIVASILFALAIQVTAKSFKKYL